MTDVNMGIKRRFKQIRKALNLTQKGMASALGIDKTGVSKFESENEPDRVPTGGVQLALNRLFNVNIDWLESETGEMFLKKQPVIEARPTTPMAGPEDFDGNDHKYAYSDEGVVSMRVRIVPAKAQLGYLRGFADPEWFETFDYEIIPVTKEARGSYLGFETVGESMVNLTTLQWAKKSIFPDRIAIGRELNREHWRSKLHIHANDAWVVVHKTDGILLKEIVDHDPETGLITLHSWNPDKSIPEYQDKVFHLDDVAQLFNVLQVVDKRR